MDAMAQLPLPAGLGAGTFPAKLWSLVNDPHVCSLRWGSEARGLLVDRSLFKRELLRPGGAQGPAPHAFKATQFCSFMYQLNCYGFCKVPGRAGAAAPGDARAWLHYRNPWFRRNCPDLLFRIRCRSAANLLQRAAGPEGRRHPPCGSQLLPGPWPLLDERNGRTHFKPLPRERLLLAQRPPCGFHLLHQERPGPAQREGLSRFRELYRERPLPAERELLRVPPCHFQVFHSEQLLPPRWEGPRSPMQELYGEQLPPLDQELLWMQPCSFQQLHREQQPPASNPSAAPGTSAPQAPAGSAGCAASTASSSAQNAPAQEESPALDLGQVIEKMIREIRNSLPVKPPSAQGNINVAPESPGHDPMNRAAAEEVSSGTESCRNSSPEPEEPDLKDAFFCLPIHEDSQKIFAFEWENPKSGRNPSSHATQTKEACVAWTVSLLNFLGLQGYRVSMKKAQVVKQKVIYLGYEISAGQRTLGQDCKEAISQTLRPQTVKELRTFFGMTGWCRLWIHSYGLLVKPLCVLITNKNRNLQWTKEAMQAFHQLKNALMSAPALGLPNVSKPFFLFSHENQGIALGILAQDLGPYRRAVAYFSKQLDTTAKGWPGCLRAVAAVVLNIQEAHKFTLGQKMTVFASHTVSAVLEVKSGHWLSPQRFLKYQAIMVEQDDVEIVVTNIINPASFLSGNQGEPVHHDCLETIEASCSSFPDLKDTPLDDAETWFTDGSSYVISGKRHAGYAVTTCRELIESGPLPTDASAQKAEIMALTRALEIAKGKKIDRLQKPLKCFSDWLRIHKHIFCDVCTNNAAEAAGNVQEFVTHVGLFLFGTGVSTEEFVNGCFDTLFAVVSEPVINPGPTDSSLECADASRWREETLGPLEAFPKKATGQVGRSLSPSWTFPWALNLGIAGINARVQPHFSTACSKALLRMQHCPHCPGLTLSQPCMACCPSTMPSCLAGTAGVGPHWHSFIQCLQELSGAMSRAHGTEHVLLNFHSLVQDALRQAQINGAEASE
ncbi:hypothetical protein DUI87_30506 [Hirundo rustica rustica]|uniref:HSF-type DNA-binding domain-containing protein n=1 Tax=Hirundo rustica rustica TaxID=333673 RepID=A0A3M0IYG2_HIRRU|nr:hypothetical protein DUI87_30506 [Hirundo rustica rustica]